MNLSVNNAVVAFGDSRFFCFVLKVSHLFLCFFTMVFVNITYLCKIITVF